MSSESSEDIVPHRNRCLYSVINRHGDITILVNNACFWNLKRFEEQQWSDFQQFAIVNMVGIPYLTKRVIQHQRERGIPGSIIFISSIHEETIRREHPPYSMCKAGLAMLAKELAVEYGPYRIRVNSIAPGHIEIEPELVRQGVCADNCYIPLGGKSGLPEDIANMAVILASREVSRHVTGATIHVDGGERLYSEWVNRLPPVVL